jgi:hypothetical protein
MAMSWTGTSALGFGAASAMVGTPRTVAVATEMTAAKERRDLRKGVLHRTCGNRPPTVVRVRDVRSRAQVTPRKRLVTKLTAKTPDEKT